MISLTPLIATPDRAASDRQDRGAMTIIGMGMGTFLVGCFGYMVGSAKAMLNHDQLQEASDAVTYAGSAAQGRGMNLISSLNLIMLIMVAIFIALCVIVDILQVGLIALTACAATIFGAPVCGPLIGVTTTASQTAERIRDGYERVIQPILRGIGYGQTAVAIVTPITAQVAALRTAIKYKQTGISFSPSIIPGTGAFGSISGNFGGMSGNVSGGLGGVSGSVSGLGSLGSLVQGKIGLPVAHEKMGALCGMAGGYILNKLRSMLGRIPGIGQILNLPGISKAVNNVIGTFTKMARNRYCSGGFWAQDGPKKMWKQAENGNDWMQTWSFTFNKKKLDPDQHFVDVGARIFSLAQQQPKMDLPNFFAMSEFFFDCDAKWGSDRCNGAKNAVAGNYDQALYSMKWRSRLRRFRPPQLGDMFAGYMKDYFGKSQFGGYLKGSVKELDAVKEIQDKVGGGFAGDVVDGTLDQVDGMIPGSAKDPFGFVGGKINAQQAQLYSKIPGAGSGPTSLILH